MTAYSSLGMVKLSRTSRLLGFHILGGTFLASTDGFLAVVTLLPCCFGNLGCVVTGEMCFGLAAATGFATLTGSGQQLRVLSQA